MNDTNFFVGFMKATILLLIIFTLFISKKEIIAKERKFKKFELELGAGYPFAAGKRGADKVEYGTDLYIEGRFNLKRLPLNAGFLIDIYGFNRTWNKEEDTYGSASIIALSDYSFRQGKLVNPFAGIGIGISSNSIDHSREGFSPCLMPRVGIRFFRHISLTLDYGLRKKYFSHADLKLGFYF